MMGDEKPEVVEAAVDGKITESRPVEPVRVSVLGIGDASKIQAGTVAVTEGLHVPNFIVEAVNPATALLVRFVYVFLYTLTGTFSLKMAPASDNMVISAIQAADFHAIMAAGCSMALATAAAGLLKDMTTVFSGLTKKFPLLGGSV